MLSRHLAWSSRSQTEKVRATPLSTAHPKKPSQSSPKAVVLSQAKREERLAQYEQVVALRKQGFSRDPPRLSQVGIGHATVSRWLRSETFPERAAAPTKGGD